MTCHNGNYYPQSFLKLVTFFFCTTSYSNGFKTRKSSFIFCQLKCLLLCRWVLLETLDKVSPGIVNWKIANKPPIKLPFRKVENCNQVVKIGKQLKFSLVNIAGNDIVQGNKKLILGMLITQQVHLHVLLTLKLSFPWKSEF